MPPEGAPDNPGTGTQFLQNIDGINRLWRFEGNEWWEMPVAGGTTNTVNTTAGGAGGTAEAFETFQNAFTDAFEPQATPADDPMTLQDEALERIRAMTMGVPEEDDEPINLGDIDEGDNDFEEILDRVENLDPDEEVQMTWVDGEPNIIRIDGELINLDDATAHARERFEALREQSTPAPVREPEPFTEMRVPDFMRDEPEDLLMDLNSHPSRGQRENGPGRAEDGDLDEASFHV